MFRTKWITTLRKDDRVSITAEKVDETYWDDVQQMPLPDSSPEMPKVTDVHAWYDCPKMMLNIRDEPLQTERWKICEICAKRDGKQVTKWIEGEDDLKMYAIPSGKCLHLYCECKSIKGKMLCELTFCSECNKRMSNRYYLKFRKKCLQYMYYIHPQVFVYGSRKNVLPMS